MSPTSREVQLAARHASAVFKAVVHGPHGPAPAAWGVEPADFQRALPWFLWRELVTFANHFGQRGMVKEEIAAELAAEIRRRMGPHGKELEGTSTSSAAAKAMASRWAQEPREVVAVVYAFSKLVPQRPEYAPVYDGVACGLQRGAWRLSRLQAALIGTALADVDLHLADALPAVVLPVIHELCDSADARAKISVDELRYLVHACVKLPRPGLKAEEVDVLASCSRRLVDGATFATAAHLTASWLQLRPPPGAKKAHQDALHAVCGQLFAQRPTNPAHPLPAAGLAPAIAGLLARESQREPPPLTPPKFRQVVLALVQISRGLRSENASKSRSLSLGDWAEIAWLAVEFCEAHAVAGAAGQGAASARQLPGWAAEMLGHVFSSTHQHTGPDIPSADLDTVLSLLRLMRRYDVRPAPRRHFFTWASMRIVEHFEAGRADPVTLAAAVGELVPRLPEQERSQLTRVLLASANTAGGAPPPRARPPARPEPPAPPPRLFAGGSGPRQPPAPAPDVTLARAPAGAAAAAVCGGGRAAGAGLWGLLADAGAPPSAAMQALAPTPRTAPGKESSAATLAGLALEPRSVLQAQAEAATAEPVLAVAPAGAREPESVQAQAQPVVEGVKEAAGVRELRVHLEHALQRVEALEARLEEESRRRVEAAAAAASPAGAVCAGPPANGAGAAVPPRAPPLGGWEPDALFHSGVGDAECMGRIPGIGSVGTGGNHSSAPAMPAGPPVYLHRPFIFEEFRRAQSRQLQSERLRVLCPPDHFPMWPLQRK